MGDMSELMQIVRALDEEILRSVSGQAEVKKGRATVLHGRANNVVVGDQFPLKVNTNIGVADIGGLDQALHLLETLCGLPYEPDTLMDHTIVKFKKPFWQRMVDVFDGPVGGLPHYLSYYEERGIHEKEFLEAVQQMAEYGVSFMTLHVTPNRRLYEVAKSCRRNPTTSRGGAVVLRDMDINKREHNVIEKHLDSILAICRKNNVAISVGSTFRPSCIAEAWDIAHQLETSIQASFVKRIKAAGVGIMMEGIGHANLSVLHEYCEKITKIDVPFMPLGPIPTDSAIGFDHMSGAIGAVFMANMGAAHIINSISREEHTGGVPSNEAIIEGLMAARVAAHCVNVTKFHEIEKIDNVIARLRQLNRTCVVSGGLFASPQKTLRDGCDRCRFECPLRIGLLGDHHVPD